MERPNFPPGLSTQEKLDLTYELIMTSAHDVLSKLVTKAIGVMPTDEELSEVINEVEF